ncbi:MAG: ATP-binding protein [Oscillospiraceae bacterium]|nr:ATP-binding protein [Oscillospiraceae bacterium]
MKKAIYYRLIALTFVAVLICSFITAMIYAINTQNQTKDWLTKLTLSAAENYKYDSDVYVLSNAAGKNRITIIAPDGMVLADSEANITDMENHADREEVKHAKTGSVTIVMRTSSTTVQKFMYAAIKTGDGNILRLAHSYSGLFNNLTVQLPAILTAIVATLILSLFLASRFTRAVTNPLEKMVDALSTHEYDKLAEYKSPYYEIDKMMQTLQELLQKITDSNIRLQDEREKVETILSNMAEGFVLLDNKKNILLCNNSARGFFSVSNNTKLENIYNLTRNQIIGNALQSAIDSEQSTMFDMELKKSLIASIYVSPSRTADDELGATIMIVDMTAERQLEQQKRDFFSNASHELKTPITSIIGFSEMLNKGMVKSEQEKSEIISRIETEAKRMSVLIGDILTISKLESDSSTAEYADVKFDEVIREAVAAVSPIKDITTINISIDLDDILYRADKRQIYELCVNLIENAVKYNKPGGKVDISLKEENENVVFAITDTGIGIPLQYQLRVFERFYRVDYGRDKKIGGTGLGLSIVKHIVSIYGGKISLQSKKDNGTTVTVFLPV